ncbi:uncharacterized protein B0J16DRAFT_375206 [Fusarium flagelliforme]|uniref:Uncharacterized protein n=1 Tax=Fusarium flagelliforme TaxID=2675880 RepID=A0A395MZW6_9HYPO|nr:uncharacterized protein B0J16DRAFT_375206 [Fusarium flagelliforme]KAH7174334.1 hypothetical protein B0J16DRAFT_375206 [Fusarium flagelliforme]RFN53257.1 hypothetical protein FIE12Z_2476 [Fusarium flagelliforme]
MHLSNLRLLAVGLAGLDIAVGSPCKPISSASDSSIATTATTSGSSTFTLTSDSSATVATTTTEAVTPTDTTTGVTTVTEVDTTTTTEATTFATSVATTEATTEETTVTEKVTASTEATTSGGMSSEATTFATSAATTEETSATVADTTAATTATSDAVTTSAEITEAPTTTEATTTAAPTTTTAPTVPMFRLVPESGTYANQAITSNRYQGTKLSFNSRSGYPDAFFTVDPTTGYLLLDGTKPICGFTPGDGTSALQVCSDNRSLQEQFITCEAPTSRQLECTVPELFCSMFTQRCDPTGNLWGTTYIGPSGGSGIDTLFLGPDYSQGNTAVPLLIVHNSD